MNSLLELSIGLHAVAGAVVLVAAGGALFTRKGSPNHRRAGRVFAVGMVLAVALASVAIVARANVLLATLGPFSAWMAAAGWRAGQSRPAGKVDRVLLVGGVLSVASMLVLGTWSMMTQTGMWPVPLVLSGFGALLVRSEWRRGQRASDRKERIRAHIGLMLGATIAATTAFAAVNLSASGLPPLLIWLGPTFVGVILMRVYSRPYR